MNKRYRIIVTNIAFRQNNLFFVKQKECYLHGTFSRIAINFHRISVLFKMSFKCQKNSHQTLTDEVEVDFVVVVGTEEGPANVEPESSVGKKLDAVAGQSLVTGVAMPNFVASICPIVQFTLRNCPTIALWMRGSVWPSAEAMFSMSRWRAPSSSSC